MHCNPPPWWYVAVGGRVKFLLIFHNKIMIFGYFHVQILVTSNQGNIFFEMGWHAGKQI